MKKIFLAVIVCAAVSSCAFMGINGSYIPAGTYRSIMDSADNSVVTTVILSEGKFRYDKKIDGDLQVWYEATFDTLTDIGHNGYEAVLTSIDGRAGSSSWSSLNTSIAQLKMYYNSPTLTISLDVNGNGSFSDRIIDFDNVSFAKQ